VRISRREVIARGAAGAMGLFSYTVAGEEKSFTPADARKANAAFRTLQPAEVALLEALSEVLLPGSAASGVAHYIDHQLSVDPSQSMLMIKYLRVDPPYTAFYRAALRAVDEAARHAFGRSVRELNPAQGHALVSEMATGSFLSWNGPPSREVYFVLRSDAVDVVFGTEDGFARLHMQYMAHIAPPTRWGEG